MTTYVIDYTDPLRDGFSITPGGFNGPGGSASATTLRLYGRGALEWGESVDEDLLRLTENFNGATPPPYAIGGQLWLQTKYYWLRTGFTWYRLDPDTPTVWDDIGFTGTNSVNFWAPGTSVTGTNTPAPAPTIGTYWYTGASPVGFDAFGNPLTALTLYRWDSAFKQVPQGWMPRAFSTKTTVPVGGTDFPERSLLLWDEFQSIFTSPPISVVSLTPPVLTPGTGQGTLWWDSSTNTLNVWNGTSWDPIATTTGIGSFLRLDGTNSPSANLNFGGFRLTNIGNAVAASDALNTTIGNSIYLRRDGTTTLAGTLTLVGAGVQIIQPNAPTLGTHLTNKTYVDGAITAAGGATAVAFSFANSTTSVTHKPGDIYVDTSVPKAYVAVTSATSAPTVTADWKQFWPAQYS